MDKTEIRRRMRALRKELTGRQVDAASRQIAERVARLAAERMPRSIHLYRSHAAWNEIDTTKLSERIRNDFADIELCLGSVRTDAPVPEDRYDMIIVPLLAFDDGMGRVGHGGGWYDRFLAGQPHALKLGLAYDFQRVDDTYAEPHDIALDVIVTPGGVHGRA